MDPRIEELYQQARRFDEGELYQMAEYTDLSKKRSRLLEKLSKLIGPAFEYAVDQMLESVDQEIELECKHYFYEGYLAGKADREREQ